MNVTESTKFLNIAAGNTAAFTVEGGRYALKQQSTGSGTVTLQELSMDGSTWLNAVTPLATTTNCVITDLPPGQFRFSITGFTANYVSITRVPV